MREKILIAISLVCLVLFTIGIVTAQDASSGIPSEIAISDLFTWLLTNPPNLVTGATFFILGFVGALVAIYGLIGGVIPGTNGKALLELQIARLENEEKRLDQMILDPKANPELLKAVEIAVNNIRDDITQERRKQFNQAAVIYLILGAFFAAMLATNMLQAIVIGFGWTAVIGVLGLKNDYEYRATKKDEVIEKLEQVNTQLIEYQKIMTKQIDELSEKMSKHNPETGSVRTDADIERNKALSAIIGGLKQEIGIKNIAFADKSFAKEVSLVRKL